MAIFFFFPCFFRARPVDSPYAREKMRAAGGKGKPKKKGKRKGPDGQKEAPLSELDMLVGDVLYFNHRVSDSLLYKHAAWHGFPLALLACVPEGDGTTFYFILYWKESW